MPQTAGPGSDHNEPSSEYQLQMPGVSANNMQMAAVSETPHALSSDMQTNGGLSIVAKKRPPPMQIGWNDYGIAPDRQVLYRNFHDISNKIYLVEISRTARRVFFILFPNFEKPKIFLYEAMTEK